MWNMEYRIWNETFSVQLLYILYSIFHIPYSPFPLRQFGIVCTIIAAVFLAFGHSLFQDFAPIDDTLLVIENLAIRGMTWDNLRYVFTHFDPELYIPLTFVSYQLNFMAGGLHPFGFHLGNLLIHAANAMLVYVFVARIIHGDMARSRDSVAALPGAFHIPHSPFHIPLIAALLFAVHPLHTETVVWIAGRKDLLFTFFYLATLLAYIRGGRLGIAAIAFAFLAMLSKASAITIPAILLLIDWYRSQDRVAKFLPVRLFVRITPFCVLSVVFAVVALLGKTRIVGASSFMETSLVALRSTVHYLWQMLVPVSLSVFYQQRLPISILQPVFAIALLAFGAVLLLAWRYRHSAPWVTFGLLFYVITLSPTYLNFHKGLISFYAVDRYAYLPSVGILFIFSVFLAYVSTKIVLWCAPHASVRPSSTFHILHSVPVAFLVLVLAVLSRYQTRVWDSPESLYRHAVTIDPASVPARSTLASVLRQTGKKLEAFSVLKEGLSYGDDVSYHLEAANIYAANGQVHDAIQEFSKASQLQPDLPEPYFSIGSLHEHLGNVDAALEGYAKALSLDPSYVAARTRIASIAIERKDFATAEAQLLEALRWNQSSYPANVQMYRLKEAQGREEEGRVYLQRAKVLRPGDAALNSRE